jgi:hypothetical protein
MNRRLRRLEREIDEFLPAYGRKRRKNFDPNDRGFDHRLPHKLRRMRPEDIDALIHGRLEEE